MQHTIGVVIPTYQAAKHLPFCLPPLLHSSLKPKILVIDSSSTDGTAALAKEMGVEVVIIPKNTFNHGTTREKGRQILNTSIVVMITQDAYLCHAHMLELLIAPLIENKASVSYARQLPHRDAKFLATFAREFNYPNKSHLRTLEDKEIYGVYTFFCSNSCAAYLNSALDEIGGFPEVLFGEDTICVAKLLHKQHAIAYVAEAQVFHSHDYTLLQEFKRHFDIGLSRRRFSHLIETAGKDTKRGKTFVCSLIKHLWKEKPFAIPYAGLNTLAKLMGYQIGKRALHAPLWMKRKLSSQKEYWNAKS